MKPQSSRKRAFILSMNRNQFIEDALSFVGLPYAHQGRNENIAVDCIGFLSITLAKQGYMSDYPKAYKRISATDNIRVYLEKHFDETEDYTPGNIIIFKQRRVFFHTGVLLPDNKMVHAINLKGSHTGGVIVSSLKEESKWLNYSHKNFNLESIRR